MTRTEAEELARQIVNTFRSTPPWPVWVDALEPLNVGTAAATLAALRDEVEQGSVLVGRFMGRYRTLLAPRPGVACGRCHGDGWVECTDQRRHRPGCAGGGCYCHAVVPCPACTSGHPVPPYQDPPLTFAEYIARCLARGDSAEVARWEAFSQRAATALHPGSPS